MDNFPLTVNSFQVCTNVQFFLWLPVEFLLASGIAFLKKLSRELSFNHVVKTKVHTTAKCNRCNSLITQNFFPIFLIAKKATVLKDVAKPKF